MPRRSWRFWCCVMRSLSYAVRWVGRGCRGLIMRTCRRWPGRCAFALAPAAGRPQVDLSSAKSGRATDRPGDRGVGAEAGQGELLLVTVKYASRSSTAGHHAAVTRSRWPFEVIDQTTPPGVRSPTTAALTCTDGIFGKRTDQYGGSMDITASGEFQ
jgi:hypothetical protein